MRTTRRFRGGSLSLLLFAGVLTVLAAPAADAQAAGASPPTAAGGHADPLAPLSFLLGDWEGAGGGPGQGTGSFSFNHELQQKVLLRLNHARFPAAADKPAVEHDDLMVIYCPGEGEPLRAVYFDSEGHVIHYQVELDAKAPKNRQIVTFLSEAAYGKPRYRLVYRMTGAETVDIRFEIAPPEKLDAFAPHITATARRIPVL